MIIIIIGSESRVTKVMSRVTEVRKKCDLQKSDQRGKKFGNLWHRVLAMVGPRFLQNGQLRVDLQENEEIINFALADRNVIYGPILL